jgi:hypothetical protein
VHKNILSLKEWSRRGKSYSLAIPGKIDAILIPEPLVYRAFEALLDKLEEKVAQVGNVNTAPSTQALSHLKTASTLQYNPGQLWYLYTPLVGGSSPLAVYDWGKN